MTWVWLEVGYLRPGTPSSNHREPAHLGFLHLTLTENYTFRGLWEVLITTAVLVVGSYASPAPAAEKVRGLTVDWRAPVEPLRGLTDWRLQAGIFLAVTAGLYAWLW